MGQILLVEDDPILRETFAEIMSFEGYQVEAVGNGQEALDQLQKTKVDLIISDVRMPVMGGIEMLHEIKAKYQKASPPVLLISGYSEDYTRDMAISIGAADLIGKPVNVDDLLNKIKGYF